MPYQIHIHRRTSLRAAPGEGDISLDEVRSLAARYPHMEFIEIGERRAIGACCGGEVRVREENILMGFQLKDGALHADYVDDETILRALYLAGLLKAKVQGDEGEIYHLSADGVSHSRS